MAARNIWSKLLIGPQPTEIIGSIRRDDFDKDFMFGSASSAYQFEGAAKEGGRGSSIWDSWTHNKPEKVKDGSNGDVAIGQYHLYKEDVKLMKKTGFERYRFSISWPRILPGGRLSTGINKEGIKYYNDLIDTLLAEGIEPCVTLFHWDLPLALELEYGGLLSDKIIKDYLEYVELCFWEFGDRVKNWITFNEPWTYITSGYVTGTYPPGHGSSSTHPNNSELHRHLCGYKGTAAPVGAMQQTSNSIGDTGTEPYLAGHNLLLAHAYAVDLYRKNFQASQGGKIGITNVSHFFEPYTDTNEDRNATIRALDWMLGWFVAPIATGDYPLNMRKSVGDRLPKFTLEEAKLVKGSYDFLGLNYYTTYYAVNTPKILGEKPSYLSDQEVTSQSSKDGVLIGDPSGSDWLVIVPRGIYNLLVYTKETYKIDLIYITENGVDEVNDASLTISEARIDPIRVKFYGDHLWYLKKAIREAGVNVKAYFVWSFADDFEWNDGYSIRFGIFYVDYKNGLTRYPKSSAIWWMNFFNNRKLLKLGSLKRDDNKENHERKNGQQKKIKTIKACK